MFMRNPYNYDVDEASVASGLSCPEPTRTQQHQAAEADINLIVKRFSQTGLLPNAAKAPTYADFSEVVDFQSAQIAIRSAQEAFMTLPANVRYRFNNDPGAFVDFCSEEGNRSELIDLGLIPPPPVAEA